MLRIVAATRVAEAFTAAGLLIVIGTALLVNQVGLSLSLGAFLAGVLLADSEYRHELEADIEPFKGLLLGLFFISVGMSANLELVREKPLLIAGLTLGFMLVKVAVLRGIGKAAGMSTAAGRGLAFSLPSGGEFAFVLFGLAATLGIMEAGTAELLVLVVTASMILSPLLLIVHDALFKKKETDERPFDTPEELYPRVIIAGFGRFGQIVGRILRAKQIPFTALEASQTQVDFLRRFGNQVFYGDASRLELLRAAHAENAAVFVLAIDDVEASVRTAEMIIKHFPHLKILARARNRQHSFRLMDLGVRYIVRETLLSSLEMRGARARVAGVRRGAKAVDTVRRFRLYDDSDPRGSSIRSRMTRRRCWIRRASRPSSCCTCSRRMQLNRRKLPAAAGDAGDVLGRARAYHRPPRHLGPGDGGICGRALEPFAPEPRAKPAPRAAELRIRLPALRRSRQTGAPRRRQDLALHIRSA